MNYLVRFADFIDDVDDSRKIKLKYGDLESAVDEFLEVYWHESDCPEAPFKVAACEADEQWNPVSKETVYEIGSIDYSPNFYYSEVEGREQDSSSTLSNDTAKIPTPTKTEQKTGS